MTPEAIAQLDWTKMRDGIPAVVQHAETLQVLMLGYMNREALEATMLSKKVTFFSRSKGRLWMKGETSGNVLGLVSVEADCDGDALLVKARPSGPTCHRETTSCFGDETAGGLGFLGFLSGLVEERQRVPVEGSYTTRLFSEGLDRMAQKVGEEAVEVVIAAKNEDKASLSGEAADLCFHLLVLLRGHGLDLSDVVEVLRKRHVPRTDR